MEKGSGLYFKAVTWMCSSIGPVMCGCPPWKAYKLASKPQPIRRPKGYVNMYLQDEILGISILDQTNHAEDITAAIVLVSCWPID